MKWRVFVNVVVPVVVELEGGADVEDEEDARDLAYDLVNTGQTSANGGIFWGDTRVRAAWPGCDSIEIVDAEERE